MNIPRGNVSLMALSVLLAILLWIWVGAEEQSEVIVSVPLEYRNLPTGFEIASKDELISQVDVWVRGDSATVKNLRSQEISAWLDLRDTRSGIQLYSLTPESVRVPYGLTVLRITPPQMELQIEEIARRMVPIVPRLEGKLPEGYAVSQKVVTPAQVEIIGPLSAVNSVREAVTDTIDVSSITADQMAKVKVGVENSDVRLGGVREVSVLLRVSEIEDIRTLKNIVITSTAADHVVKINPRAVRVDIRAPLSVLATVTEAVVTATVDTKGLNAGMYELTPQLEFDVPDRGKISVQNVVPPRVRVKIQ